MKAPAGRKFRRALSVQEILKKYFTITPNSAIISVAVGAWLSLVERLNGVQEAASSILVAPT